MPKYLVNVSYTAEGAKGLRKDGGTKRVDVVEKTIAGLGGKLDAFYFCLGKHDAIAIVDLPDVVTLAALSVTVAAAGGVTCSSTELLTREDMDRACSKKNAYKAPGA